MACPVSKVLSWHDFSSTPLRTDKNNSNTFWQVMELGGDQQVYNQNRNTWETNDAYFIVTDYHNLLDIKKN